MSDIPSDLLREIFLRLPAESLLRLRRVCKQWVRIIDDSSFIKNHTNYQHNNQHRLLLKNGLEGTLYSFSLDSLHFTNGPQTIDATHITQLAGQGIPRKWRLFNWSFCNSLILMHTNHIPKKFVIWNPLTKERRYVDLPELITAAHIWRYAFGYDYDADDYKVVIIDYPRADKYWQTFVYSLKSNSWRKIQDCPWRKIQDCPKNIIYYYMGNTSLNGTLYWPTKHTIIALHLGTERFSELPLPLVNRSSEFNSCTDFQLNALDGCLIFSLDYHNRKTCYGWVMKDNGVEKSWIKLFSLRYSVYEVSSRLRPVAYLKSKGQVVLQHYKGFLWIDTVNNSIKKFSIHGFLGNDSSINCPGSLVRLHARVTTRKRKRKTERTVTRLKFCVRNVREMCCSDDHRSCIENKCSLCRLEEQ